MKSQSITKAIYFINPFISCMRGAFSESEKISGCQRLGNSVKWVGSVEFLCGVLKCTKIDHSDSCITMNKLTNHRIVLKDITLTSKII